MASLRTTDAFPDRELAYIAIDFTLLYHARGSLKIHEAACLVPLWRGLQRDIWEHPVLAITQLIFDVRVLFLLSSSSISSWSSTGRNPPEVRNRTLCDVPK